MAGKKPSVLIIVPSYNEGKGIVRVLRRLKDGLPKGEAYSIVVVDDGSSDRTTDICRKFGFQVLRLPNNLGIGGAVQTGFKYAVREGFDAAVQYDADGQHRVEEITKIVRPIVAGKADVVVGSRFIRKEGYTSQIHRRIGIFLMSIVLAVAMGQRITDQSSGFRALNRRALAYFAKNYPVDYPDAEALLLLKLNGFRILEVPVIMNPRAQGSSSITFTKSFYYLFKTSVSILATLIRRR